MFMFKYVTFTKSSIEFILFTCTNNVYLTSNTCALHHNGNENFLFQMNRIMIKIDDIKYKIETIYRLIYRFIFNIQKFIDFLAIIFIQLVILPLDKDDMFNLDDFSK